MLTPRALVVPLIAFVIIAALPRPATQMTVATCGVTTSETARSTSDPRAVTGCVLPNERVRFNWLHHPANWR